MLTSTLMQKQWCKCYKEGKKHFIVQVAWTIVSQYSSSERTKKSFWAGLLWPTRQNKMLVIKTEISVSSIRFL